MKRHPEAEALWFLMHHSDDPRKLALALTCYCDDSGSHDESEAAVVGAVLMNKPRFIEFYLDWRKILKEFRIDGIHMQDFVRPYGRYSAMAPEMKKALFSSVAKAINQKKEYSVSVSVPQADYKYLMSVGVRRELMGAYAMAFFMLVMINRECSAIRGYNNRIAYLIDKGSRHHHDQLQAAHGVILEFERDRTQRYTGAMAADLDDNNYALQAADVIAWSYHRQGESQSEDEEFSPLLAIFKESQLPPRPDGAVLRPHIKFDVPSEGITIWATLINEYITATGVVPSWPMILEHSKKLEEARKSMTQSEYETFDQTMRQLMKVKHSEIKAALDAEKAEKQKKKRKAKKSSASGHAVSGKG